MRRSIRQFAAAWLFGYAVGAAAFATLLACGCDVASALLLARLPAWTPTCVAALRRPLVRAAVLGVAVTASGCAGSAVTVRTEVRGVPLSVTVAGAR